jgi:hypothetical protein
MRGTWMIVMGAALILGASRDGWAATRASSQQTLDDPQYASLRATFITAQENGAGAEYGVSRAALASTSEGEPLWTAFNRAERERVEFLSDGVRVAPADGAAHAVELRLSRLGRANALTPAARASAPTSSGNRVEYRRGDALTEWYANGPVGLEQCFTLAAPPSGAGPVGFERVPSRETPQRRAPARP